ncbi:hypothetical protein QZH41_002649 [Actinostola sp. cb2023]|nr:hypothetical protein QZH41_002649 [Actinostola sp. cb2023]
MHSNYSSSIVQVATNGSRPLDNSTSRLYLKSAGISLVDAGNYTCTATNGVGALASKTVEVLSLPVIITTLDLDRVVERGAWITLICNATGDPEPAYRWSKNSMTLTSSSDHVDFLDNEWKPFECHDTVPH